LDHTGLEEGLRDVGGRLAGLHLYGHLSGAGGGVVRGGEEAFDLVVAKPPAGAEAAEQDERQQQREDGPAEPPGRAFLAARAPAVAAPPGGGPPMPGSPPLAILLLPRELELVQPQTRLRCASSQPCKISTAAAWSTTARWRLPRTPRSASLRAAATVDILSSVRRTGTGSTTVFKISTYRLVADAAGPSFPARLRGRPTTTSTASYSCISWEISLISDGKSSRCVVSREMVASGVARIPSGSDTATPTRTPPRSIPTRTPRLTTAPRLSRDLGQLR